MDYIKDTRKDSVLSSFFDALHATRTNPFGENKAADRGYRRAERLIAAIYLLTNHIPSNEPLRNAIRSTSISLLSEILAFRDDMRAFESPKFIAFQSTARELISLIRLLAVSGLISIQNTDVITEALDELVNFLAVSQRSPISESVRFSREDFLDAGPMYSGPKKDVKDVLSIKDRKTSDGDVLYKTTPQITARSNSILDILRSGGEMGIRDIIVHIPEYSEKMIQRKLLDLVQTGQVKKVGAKRWSKYSII